MNGRSARRRKLSNSTERQIRERHVRRLKRLQRRRLIFRGSALVILVVLLLFAIVFLTPLFNIRKLNIQGNSRVDTQTVVQQLPDVEGVNLFKVSEGEIRKRLMGITYISDVEVEKNMFPPSVSVIITEKKPMAGISLSSGYGIVDSDCNILEEITELPAEIPELTFYHESFDDLKGDSTATGELKRFFEIADKIDIAGQITAIELLEENEINFEYDGRLEVICGSGLDMEKKLPLLKETVNNPALGANAHGQIDLSTTGKAVHIP